MAVTTRQNASALLRRIDEGNLFLVALDDERTSFRYHHLVRELLRAELRARDRGREQALQLRAAEWFESTGDTRRAARHFLAAQQVHRALTLLQDRVITEFLHDPSLPAALDLSMVDPSLLADAPDLMLAVAGDLLTWGDTAHAGEYLDLLERAQPSICPESRLAARFAAMRSFRRFQRSWAALSASVLSTCRPSLAAYSPIALISMALTTVGTLALLSAALSRRLPANDGPYAYARIAFSDHVGFANA